MSTTRAKLPELEEAVNGEQDYSRRIALLLILLLIACIAIEGFSRMAYPHMRRKQAIEAEVRDALSIRDVHDGRVQILFAGNSLIQEGTDTAALQQSMGDNFQVHRVGVPGSFYDDWRYGVRSLLDRGSRPQIIVLGIGPAQLLQDRPATLLPATRIWNVNATFAYYFQRHRKLTEVSNLFFARYSTFFYLREQFRTDLRGKFPGFERLANHWMGPAAYRQPKTEDKEQMLALARGKLEALRIDCDRQNVKIIYLIIPTRQPDDTALEPLVKQAAQEAHVPVIEPVKEDEWALNDFADGYHLTHTAAVRFSGMVGKEVASRISAATTHASL